MSFQDWAPTAISVVALGLSGASYAHSRRVHKVAGADIELVNQWRLIKRWELGPWLYVAVRVVNHGRGEITIHEFYLSIAGHDHNIPLTEAKHDEDAPDEIPCRMRGEDAKEWKIEGHLTRKDLVDALEGRHRNAKPFTIKVLVGDAREISAVLDLPVWEAHLWLDQVDRHLKRTEFGRTYVLPPEDDEAP